jgi:hypothetical protein
MDTVPAYVDWRACTATEWGKLTIRIVENSRHRPRSQQYSKFALKFAKAYSLIVGQYQGVLDRMEGNTSTLTEIS